MSQNLELMKKLLDRMSPLRKRIIALREELDPLISEWTSLHNQYRRLDDEQAESDGRTKRILTPAKGVKRAQQDGIVLDGIFYTTEQIKELARRFVK